MTRLILPAQLAHDIAIGRVTMQRRPVDNRRPRLVRKTHIGGTQAHMSKPWAPTRGERLTVHRDRDDQLSCHAELTAHRRERHGHPPAADLAAHGHTTLASYARQWLLMHDGDWLWQTTEPVRRHDDNLTSATLLLTDDQAQARFDHRWADRHVWVLTLLVVEQPDKHLAPAGRQRGADEHGHTRSETGSIGAGGYIDPTTLTPTWHEKARLRHEDANPTKRRRAA